MNEWIYRFIHRLNNNSSVVLSLNNYFSYVWMNEWMNDCTNGWMNEWINEEMNDEWINELINKGINE